jgi:hypothetical protein
VKETKELTADKAFTDALPITMDLANVMDYKLCKNFWPNPWRQPAFVNDLQEQNNQDRDAIFESNAELDLESRASSFSKRKIKEKKI